MKKRKQQTKIHTWYTCSYAIYKSHCFNRNTLYTKLSSQQLQYMQSYVLSYDNMYAELSAQWGEN